MPRDTDTQYKRVPLKFVGAGVDVHTPHDLLPPGKYTILQNVRGAREAGTIWTRPGIAPVNTDPFIPAAGEGIHSLRTLNDNIGDNDDWVGTSIVVVGCARDVGIMRADGSHAVFIPWYSGTSSVWSGRPLSFTPWRPDKSPRTWMYIWDADTMAKIGRDELDVLNPIDWTMQSVGIQPPLHPPANTAGAGVYQYRYRYRSSTTGAVSNPSPRTLLTYALGGTLTADSAADPQADTVDFYRFGGALLDYFYVGSAPDTAPTFVDNVTDADAQLNEILPTDRDMPFSVAGIPLQGTCTVAFAGGLTTVTWATGDQFSSSKNGNLNMLPGTIVELDGKPYPMYEINLSATQIIVEGNATGATRFLIQNPNLQGKALPSVWGPFQQVMLACGDTLNPGMLYWTNNNDPDSASAFNVQEVTTPSEPLLNGFVMDGRAYVFSSERLFAIFPNFSDNSRWEIIETACQRGMWTNWCYCVLGEKQGGGECYFLARDGIWMTNGGRAENITDADLYPLFPHEGDNTSGSESRGLFPVDMTQRTYLRLSHSRGYIYFDYKDTEGNLRTLTYEIESKAWYPDVYTPGLRVHYGQEGREQGELLAGANDGFIYVYGGNTDNGTAIECEVRTRSEDFGDPSVQKLIGDCSIELNLGDQPVTVTPYFNSEAISNAPIIITGGAGRQHRIIDIVSGSGLTGFNVSLDFLWSNVGAPAMLYLWMPSASPKPADIQQRCIEWHEFLPGIPDAYVTGLRLWVDTRDLTGTPQVKTVDVYADQAFTGQSLTVFGNGETPLIFSWPVFKGKLGRLLPTDTNRCRILHWEWMAENEPPLISAWDTNWTPLGERTAIGYITGIVVVADTQGVAKTLQFQTEFEGTVTLQTAIGGSNVMSASGRQTKSFAFTPFRAEQVRMFSYDGILGRLYTWEWVIHYVEGRYLANWDATYQDWHNERLIKGVRIFADTLGIPKDINLEIDNVVYTTFVATHTGRETVHYDIPLDLATNEYPRGRSVRLYPTDTSAAFLYSVEWFADEEPGRLANWNAKWEDGGRLGAKFLQGVLIDADTAGATKTAIIEYYPEGSGTTIQTAATFQINHTGRSGKAYDLDPPVVAHKFRLRPTDDAQRWLYGVEWVWEPHPEKVHVWKTQGFSQGLTGFQHRRSGDIAYESTDILYWIQRIDGQRYAIALPSTDGSYRKVYVPCLPIKGKVFEDELRCDLPDGVPLIYSATLSTVVDTYTPNT